MAYLIGIPASWFLPGLLRGIEGLIKPVLLAAVLVEPTTLRGVVGRERSVNSLAPFAIFVGTALLGGSLIEPSPIALLSLPGYLLTSLRGCSYLRLVGSGCFVAFSANSFSIFSRSFRMALGDSGTNLCVSAY